MKLLKKIGTGLLVAALAVGVVGCGNKEAEKDQMAAIKEKGTLTIGTSAEYAPFEFHSVQNGKDEIVGFDIMLANEIGKELGVKVEFKDMDFDGLIPALSSGKVDMVLAGVSPTEERKEAVDFSDIYYDGKNGVVVREEDKDKYKSDAEIKALKLGVQKGSIQENYVMNTLKAENVTALAQVPELMMELKNKNVDAVVVNDTVGMINVGKNTGIAMANVDLGSNKDESMAAAFQKGNNKELVDSVNKVIKKLKDEGKIDQMLKDAVAIAVK